MRTGARRPPGTGAGRDSLRRPAPSPTHSPKRPAGKGQVSGPVEGRVTAAQALQVEWSPRPLRETGGAAVVSHRRQGPAVHYPQESPDASCPTVASPPSAYPSGARGEEHLSAAAASRLPGPAAPPPPLPPRLVRSGPARPGQPTRAPLQPRNGVPPARRVREAAGSRARGTGSNWHFSDPASPAPPPSRDWRRQPMGRGQGNR